MCVQNFIHVIASERINWETDKFLTLVWKNCSYFSKERHSNINKEQHRMFLLSFESVASADTLVQ